MRWLRSFGYNLTQGFKGIFRNSVMSTASILVLLSCMIILGTFYLVIASIEENFDEFGKLSVIEADVSIGFSEEQIAEVGDQLRQICADSELLNDDVTFVSSAEHFQNLLEGYEDWAWTDYVADQPEQFNLLSPYYVLTFSNSAEIVEIQSIVNQIEGLHLSDGTVSVYKIRSAIELYQNVNAVKRTLTVVGLWFMGILLLISLFVIMNTIKLGVFARRNEIMFMRYCGATKSFIRTPFLVEGAIIGLFSACIALGLEYVLYAHVLSGFIQNFTSVNTTEGILLASYADQLLPLAVAFGGIGLFAGLLSSSISLKKYLKV